MIKIKKKKVFLHILILVIMMLMFKTTAFAYESEENISAQAKSLATDEIMTDSTSLEYAPLVTYSEESSISLKIINSVEEYLKSFKIGASNSDTKYDMRRRLSIQVKDQGNTEACWAFASFMSMETNLKLKYGSSPDFSEKHMNYATSNSSFYDGTNEKGFNRKVSDGGTIIISMAYLTNGQGAVLEEEMPFEDSEKNISINDINKNAEYYVRDYEIIPSIYKIVKNEFMTYTDGVNKVYTDEEVNAIRKQIKNHIINDGSIIACMAANDLKYYNSTDPRKATAYYCNNNDSVVNHAVSIVGWDDNYSRDNFSEAAKPNENGAYLVLNSYSDKSFDNGYLWISYEDVWIESQLFVIMESSQIEYENIYQNDWYGGNMPITITSGGKTINEGYYASVYDRKSVDNNESLTEVAVSLNQVAQLEIFVNPNGSDLTPENLIKVATTDSLNPGYHTIKISPIALNSNEFAVVVKHKAVNEKTYFFMTESCIENSFYSNADAQVGKSKVSINGIDWYNLGDLGNLEYDDTVIELSKSDVCIKAFTTKNNISSDKYKISHDGYISKIYDQTKIEDLLNDLNLNDRNYEIYNSRGNKVTDKSQLVETGMKIRVDENEYKLSVRGDLNGDGKISLIDLSKQMAHYTGVEGFVLNGEYDIAADINLDGKVSIIDISQLMVIFINQ